MTSRFVHHGRGVFSRATVVCALLAVAAVASAGPVLVSNPGFDVPQGTSGGLPTIVSQWSGDVSLIVGPDRGITPHGGTSMLRFDASTPTGPGGISSDVWQLIDLSAHAADIATGGVSVQWSAYFNRVDGLGSEPQFAVGIRAYNTDPATFPADADRALAAVHTFLLSDDDPTTWQRALASLVLPAATRYLGLLVAARETIDNSGAPEFLGHYADSTSFQLDGVTTIAVPEPATLALLIVAAGAALAIRRARRRSYASRPR